MAGTRDVLEQGDIFSLGDDYDLSLWRYRRKIQ